MTIRYHIFEVVYLTILTDIQKKCLLPSLARIFKSLLSSSSSLVLLSKMHGR